MARRKVTRSRKGSGGRIIGLHGPSFGTRSVQDVIEDILQRTHRYYVREAPWEAEVKVMKNGEEQRLETTKDVLSRNNLRNLPNY